MKKQTEPRHKCHKCEAVRIESKMEKMDCMETNASILFGNWGKCWCCKETYKCAEKRKKAGHEKYRRF